MSEYKKKLKILNREADLFVMKWVVRIAVPLALILALYAVFHTH